MDTFERKLEVQSLLFSDALKKFDEETASAMLEAVTNQIRLLGEFKIASVNIKEAC